MSITVRKRRQLMLQNLLYYVLLFVFTGLLGGLSVRYSAQLDWSANNRNSLSESSRVLLGQIEEPLKITVFIGEDEITRNAIRELVARYQRYKRNIDVSFVNPETNPAQARAMGISAAGELLIEYQGRQERLQQLSEQNFTNALQRLLRTEARWIVFLGGHGERDPNDKANHGFGDFGQRLADKGFNIQVLNLLEQTQIPENAHVLIMASPQADYLSGEATIINDYLNKGGNLLWLTEPGSWSGLESVAGQLALSKFPGKIVDANTQLFGITQADFALVLNYTDTPITPGFSQFTLFPQAAGITYNKESDRLGFEQQVFLQTLPRSWTEIGPIEGRIQFDENTAERLGPITLGMTLSRALPGSATKQQRVAVIGDGDFLSNAFLGNGGNLELGLNIMNWLSHEDSLIDIKPVSAPDTQLQLSTVQVIALSVFFLLILPFGMIAAGLIIWFKRRKL